MMGNRDNRFRVLAVILSALFFCAGIVVTLGIFLPVAGLTPPHYALFVMGKRVFSVYGFSSFLIPLLFLYGAVLLLIPGWSRESKAVLLGVPLYFVTAIIGERMIYAFVPSVSIPLIRHFVTVSILLCALLLICFEIFLMLTLSEKLSGYRSSLQNISEDDVVSKDNETKGDDTDTEEVSALPEDTTTKALSTQAHTSDTDTEETSLPKEAADELLSLQRVQQAHSQKVDDIPKPDAAAESDGIPCEATGTGISDIADAQSEILQREQILPIQPENSAESPVAEEELPLLEKVDDEDLSSEFSEQEVEVKTPEPEQDTILIAEKPLPLSTPLSAVMDMREEEAIRPVFDPSDPNNLFASLEEITAPVERIKQTGYSDAQAAPQLPEEDAMSIPPDTNEAAEQPGPQSSEGVADTVSQMDIIPEETISENETIADVSQTESDFSDTDITAEPISQSDITVATAAVPEASSMPPVESTPASTDSPVSAAASLEEETATAPENSAAAAVQVEPERPLVFVNGVPLPNGRSDLLDTMVVIDSETDIGAETALIPDENTAELGVAINDFDTRDEDNIASSEAETAAESDETESEIDEESSVPDDDDMFLGTVKQTVPLIPAKPAPPPPPRKKYAIPFDLLTNYPDGEYWIVDDATRRAALMLKSTFNEFKIDVSITGIRKGPVVTMFEMLPSPGIKLSKITNLQDNIALRLAASSVRIVAPIPGKHAVGIEVPNKKRSIVSFRELIETDLPEAAKMAIPVALGKDVTGNPQVLDLAQTPHLLIAGATGSGKSVCVNSIILSILYNRRPDEVKLILVDPKIVELKLYNDIAHLLTPVITEPKRAFQALQYALCEMERRYALLDNMGVRDIKTFNAKIKSEHIATETLPYIVIIIDEFADLMATSGKELEATVARLCAMSRAVGIHLVLATQRPSIDVITGLIKANIPSRIAFMVASKTDSRIILDEMGAEKLLGKGDMLYVSAARPFPTRMQGAFVSEQEVERVVACVKEYCEPEYIDEEIFVDDDDEPYDNAVFSDDNDPLYEQALEIVTFAGKASASYVQRKLKIGYNRAARLIEEMEARGIVGPANGSKPREVIRHV